MQVILLDDVSGKGKVGDVVKVSAGYARNYLLPRGIAIPATEANMKNLENRKARLAAEKAQSLEDAQAAKEKLDSLSVTLKSKAGEGGRLFGSITSQDIVTAISDEHDMFIDKRKIQLDSPIKTTGTHPVGIKIYPEVVATINVVVEATEA